MTAPVDLPNMSVAGSVRVEIQNCDGQPLPGFALVDCDAIHGNASERTAIWRGKPDLRAIAGKPMRLRFEITDADLYPCRFREVGWALKSVQVGEHEMLHCQASRKWPVCGRRNRDGNGNIASCPLPTSRDEPS